MVTTKVRSGHINVTTLGDAYNSLAADAVSIGMGLVMVISLTFIFPAKMPFIIDGVPADMAAAEAAEVAADIEEAKRDEKDMEKSMGMGQTVVPVNDNTDGNVISSHFNRHREPIVPVSALT